jgi:hypothetical protein
MSLPTKPALNTGTVSMLFVVRAALFAHQDSGGVIVITSKLESALAFCEIAVYSIAFMRFESSLGTIKTKVTTNPIDAANAKIKLITVWRALCLAAESLKGKLILLL